MEISVDFSFSSNFFVDPAILDTTLNIQSPSRSVIFACVHKNKLHINENMMMTKQFIPAKIIV